MKASHNRVSSGRSPMEAVGGHDGLWGINPAKGVLGRL